MDSIFDIFIFVKVQFEAKVLEGCSNFVQCCGVVIFEAVLYFPERVKKKKKDGLRYETALLSKKFAQFQRQALVSTPAFFKYR